MVWAELVMCRVGYVPSLLCAELTMNTVAQCAFFSSVLLD